MRNAGVNVRPEGQLENMILVGGIKPLHSAYVWVLAQVPHPKKNSLSSSANHGALLFSLSFYNGFKRVQVTALSTAGG